MKRCSKCLTEKPESDFYKGKRPGSLRAACKSCCNSQSRKHYAENREWYAAYAREHIERDGNRERANLRSNESRKRRRAAVYAAWLEYQGGACAICQEPQETWEGMHLDHDHRTGNGRGLLCRACNYLLGMADDNVEVLRRAISYLEYHGADASLPKATSKLDWWNHLPPK